jgi:hypothetical protein
MHHSSLHVKLQWKYQTLLFYCTQNNVLKIQSANTSKLHTQPNKLTRNKYLTSKTFSSDRERNSYCVVHRSTNKDISVKLSYLSVIHIFCGDCTTKNNRNKQHFITTQHPSYRHLSSLLSAKQHITPPEQHCHNLKNTTFQEEKPLAGAMQSHRKVDTSPL